MSLLRPLRQCFASVTLMVAFGIREGLRQKFIQGSELLVEVWRDVSTIKGWAYNQKIRNADGKGELVSGWFVLCVSFHLQCAQGHDSPHKNNICDRVDMRNFKRGIKAGKELALLGPRLALLARNHLNFRGNEVIGSG